jgi:hypothetical protein
MLCRALRCLRLLEAEGSIKITNKCGLHVHRDAEKYPYPELVKLEKFYFRNKNIIRFLVDPSRDFNRYCRPSSGDRYFDEDGEMTEDELLALPIEKLKEYKFAAVNILSKFYNGTVEFRQHESTFSEIEVLSWIEVTALLLGKYPADRTSIFFRDLLSSLGLSEKAQKFYITKATKRHMLYTLSGSKKEQ